MAPRTRNLVIAGIVAVALAYLVGFVPQYRRASQLQIELETLERDARLSRARDLASLTYLEVTKKNFGTAAQSATELFNSLREAMGQTQDAGLRTELEAIGSQRDAVVAGLAKADPAVEPIVRDILERLFRTTR
jgi:hypothetical protein